MEQLAAAAQQGAGCAGGALGGDVDRLGQRAEVALEQHRRVALPARLWTVSEELTGVSYAFA